MLKLKTLLLAVAMAFSAALVSAQATEAEEHPPAVSAKDAQDIAGMMFMMYRAGGPGHMLRAESECWKAFAKDKARSEYGAASCALSALSGAFIESSYARQNARPSAPAYTGPAIRARIVKNLSQLGVSEQRTDEILSRSVSPRIEDVTLGLANAGMR